MSITKTRRTKSTPDPTESIRDRKLVLFHKKVHKLWRATDEMMELHRFDRSEHNPADSEYEAINHMSGEYKAAGVSLQREFDLLDYPDHYNHEDLEELWDFSMAASGGVYPSPSEYDEVLLPLFERLSEYKPNQQEGGLLLPAKWFYEATKHMDKPLNADQLRQALHRGKIKGEQPTGEPRKKTLNKSGRKLPGKHWRYCSLSVCLAYPEYAEAVKSRQSVTKA